MVTTKNARDMFHQNFKLNFIILLEIID